MGNEAEEEYEEVDALEDSDDDFAYEEVDIDDDDDDLLGEGDEDLETAMRSLHGLGGTSVGGAATKAPGPAPGEVTKRPEVRTELASETWTGRERARETAPASAPIAARVYYIFSFFSLSLLFGRTKRNRERGGEVCAACGRVPPLHRRREDGVRDGGFTGAYRS